MNIDLEELTFDKSTKLNAKNVLLKRAFSKHLNNKLIFKLIDLHSPFEKRYRDTLYCSDKLKQVGDEIMAKYCGHRWCMVCNRIRTAKAIKKYLPSIQSWDGRWFVTLTIPNVSKSDFRKAVKSMFENFSRILNLLHKRGKKPKGLRKFEVTYNKELDNYHPHYHILVDSLEAAQDFKREWLRRYPEAVPEAQNISVADEKSVKELFKYFTKLTTSSRKNKNHVTVDNFVNEISPEALDVIFRIIKGRRVYQNFGFKALKIDEEKPDEVVKTDEISIKEQYYTWNNEILGWINDETGEILVSFEPYLTKIGILEELYGDYEGVFDESVRV